eukprot:scaffold76056_cov70-Phaeocystis_antarctica.AAC.9
MCSAISASLSRRCPSGTTTTVSSSWPLASAGSRSAERTIAVTAVRQWDAEPWVARADSLTAGRAQQQDLRHGEPPCYADDRWREPKPRVKMKDATRLATIAA